TGVFQAKMQTQDTKTQGQVTYTAEDEQAVEASSEEALDNREFIVFPNPFTHIINFKYTVKQESSPVALKIYTIAGAEITTLIREQNMAKGSYHAQFNGDDLPEGMYLYRLEIGNSVKTGKIMLKR
ncbi:MAG: T9SS type A sorting domain-containing protein, partial [Sinomicrobium sp.]|nr:T9SS type A sorting domain-containing protein [Sinomicrobium sp.]